MIQIKKKQNEFNKIIFILFLFYLEFIMQKSVFFNQIQ